MAQIIITNKAITAGSAQAVTLDGVSRTRPIKAINSAVLRDEDAASGVVTVTTLAVKTATPTGAEEIQLTGENTISIWLTADAIVADEIIANAVFVDELIRT